MGGFIVRVPIVEIFDGERGLLLHKGSFIEAPPEFFLRYGTDVVAPNKAFDPKLDHRMKIEQWYGMPDAVKARPDEAAKKAAAEAEAAAEKAKADEEAAAEKAKAEAAEANKKKAGAMTSEGSPLTGKGKKKGK